MSLLYSLIYIYIYICISNKYIVHDQIQTLRTWHKTIAIYFQFEMSWPCMCTIFYMITAPRIDTHRSSYWLFCCILVICLSSIGMPCVNPQGECSLSSLNLSSNEETQPIKTLPREKRPHRSVIEHSTATRAGETHSPKTLQHSEIRSTPFAQNAVSTKDYTTQLPDIPTHSKPHRGPNAHPSVFTGNAEDHGIIDTPSIGNHFSGNDTLGNIFQLWFPTYGHIRSICRFHWL